MSLYNVKYKCHKCNHTFNYYEDYSNALKCPKCGSYNFTVVKNQNKVQIGNNLKRLDIINKERKILLFYIDRYRYKIRSEADGIAFQEAKRTNASDVWYPTPKGDREFDPYFFHISEQIMLHFLHNRHQKQWIYVIEYNMLNSNRKTSLFGKHYGNKQ